MREIYKEEWQREDKTITISRDFLEHILNCLANQKFIGETPPNGDAMAMEESEYKKFKEKVKKPLIKLGNRVCFCLV